METVIVENVGIAAEHLDTWLNFLEPGFNLSWLVELGNWMEKMGGSTEVVDDWTFKAVDR